MGFEPVGAGCQLGPLRRSKQSLSLLEKRCSDSRKTAISCPLQRKKKPTKRRVSPINGNALEAILGIDAVAYRFLYGAVEVNINIFNFSSDCPIVGK